MKTYNQYLTEGILDGSIERVEKNGVPIYKVRAPYDGEVVLGYSSISSISNEETATSRASRGC